MKNRYFVGILLIVISIVSAGCGAKTEEKEPAPVATVKVAQADERDVDLTIQAPATVFAREQANISSRITAPILEIAVRKGDRVTKGQILVRLDNRDLVAQKREIAGLVAEAESNLEKLRTGTIPGDIERAKGQVMTTQATLSQAEKFFERRKQLFDQGAIPNRDLLISQTDLATAKANNEVARQALSLLEKQSSGRDIQIMQSRLEQARGRLASLEAQISFAELRSPFAGSITEQFVFPGDMAQPATPMFTVADLSVVIARAQVPESDVRAVRVGASCRLIPQDQKGSSFSGKVSVVNQSVDVARRTVEVWCEISNAKGDLRAQAFGTVEIVVGRFGLVPSRETRV
jgi:multidrug resistance efflux pump